ncbi:MAG: hypothetical protein IRZ10_01405 [Thermoflavifilum sp.]|nr:hypothetical protein [Thermoflavifilum sp.]MCL6513045.1 hypothetical protein [Alicyclobacillus sp.]
MRYIPSTVVLAVLCLIAAEWPGVQAWAMQSELHHYLSHLLFLLAGGLFGLQTAWWVHQPMAFSDEAEAGVTP